mmetsp:Transcript_62881/g.148021  ORF Transcript_62881/g.148021 Transcript_62881/m.148021 type:complete len:264 (-) Transcript_62881:74-865(-)
MQGHGRQSEARMNNVWFAGQLAQHTQRNTNMYQQAAQQQQQQQQQRQEQQRHQRDMRNSAPQFQLGCHGFHNAFAHLLETPPHRYVHFPEPEGGLESWSQLHLPKRTRDEDEQPDKQPNPKRPTIGFYDEKTGSWPRSDPSSMSQMSTTHNSASSWNDSNPDSRTAASQMATSSHKSRNSKHERSSVNDSHNAQDQEEEEEDLHIGSGDCALLAPRHSRTEAMQALEEILGSSEALLLAVMLAQGTTLPTPARSDMPPPNFRR